MRILLSFFTLLLASTPAFAIETDMFARTFSLQLDKPIGLPTHVRARVKEYRYVFIAGFLNEGMRLPYFAENMGALKESGVEDDQIHVYFPPSSNSVLQNKEPLETELQRLADLGKQKLILIGHSKGAVEALLVAVRNPTFIEDKVHAIFLIQGAFGGSGVADYIQGEGHEIDAKMPLLEKIAFWVAGQTGKILDHHLINRGFGSLTRRTARTLWTSVLQNEGDAVKRITDKVFYIRGTEDPSNVSKVIDCTAMYLKTYYGPNDGLVVLEDQKVDGIGTILADVAADHADLTVMMPIANTWPGFRYAFTKALVSTLGDRH